MCENGRFPKALVLGCFLVVLGWAVTAGADWTNMNAGVKTSGWVCTHGHTGQIENLTYVNQYQGDRNNIRFGWGVEFTATNGFWNWVHYSLPVPVGHKTRHINIHFGTGSDNVAVDQVHIWDGGAPVEGISVGPWSHPNFGNVSEGVTLSADHVVGSALGVSIRFVAGIGSSSSIITFHEVCADMFP